jgi:hypothetical protein
MQTIENTIRLLCDYLNKEHIEYSLVGGATLPILGAPRSTFDVDIIARIDENGARGLAEYLESKGFFASEEDIIAALREKSHCSIEYGEPPYRIDLKGVYGEREDETIKNSKQLEYLGLRVWVQSPEDAIANKLLFGSEQDLKDALSIYVRQRPTLNMGHLEKVCAKMGVGKELKALVTRAEGYL